MNNSNENYKKVFQAIRDGLVFSDERNEDDFMVLVDENRELDGFEPKKALIEKMEKDGLIKAITKETKRKYFTFIGEKRPISLISIFEITDEGKDFEENAVNDDENNR